MSPYFILYLNPSCTLICSEVFKMMHLDKIIKLLIKYNFLHSTFCRWHHFHKNHIHSFLLYIKHISTLKISTLNMSTLHISTLNILPLDVFAHPILRYPVLACPIPMSITILFKRIHICYRTKR